MINKTPINIPLERICYYLRDDICLRAYVLINNDKGNWNKFLKGANEYGLKPRSFNQFLHLYHDIKTNGIKEPIDIYKIGNKYYPGGGAHRISIAMALKLETIPVYIISADNGGSPAVFLASPREVTEVPYDVNNFRILKVFKYIDGHVRRKIVSLSLYQEVFFAKEKVIRKYNDQLI